MSSWPRPTWIVLGSFSGMSLNFITDSYLDEQSRANRAQFADVTFYTVSDTDVMETPMPSMQAENEDEAEGQGELSTLGNQR